MDGRIFKNMTTILKTPFRDLRRLIQTSFESVDGNVEDNLSHIALVMVLLKEEWPDKEPTQIAMAAQAVVREGAGSFQFVKAATRTYIWKQVARLYLTNEITVSDAESIAVTALYLKVHEIANVDSSGPSFWQSNFMNPSF